MDAGDLPGRSYVTAIKQGLVGNSMHMIVRIGNGDTVYYVVDFNQATAPGSKFFD